MRQLLVQWRFRLFCSAEPAFVVVLAGPSSRSFRLAGVLRRRQTINDGCAASANSSRGLHAAGVYIPHAGAEFQ
jgi:hypothetical protein